jgi:hypothetical protein
VLKQLEFGKNLLVGALVIVGSDVGSMEGDTVGGVCASDDDAVGIGGIRKGGGVPGSPVGGPGGKEGIGGDVWIGDVVVGGPGGPIGTVAEGDGGGVGIGFGTEVTGLSVGMVIGTEVAIDIDIDIDIDIECMPIESSRVDRLASIISSRLCKNDMKIKRLVTDKRITNENEKKHNTISYLSSFDQLVDFSRRIIFCGLLFTGASSPMTLFLRGEFAFALSCLPNSDQPTSPRTRQASWVKRSENMIFIMVTIFDKNVSEELESDGVFFVATVFVICSECYKYQFSLLWKMNCRVPPYSNSNILLFGPLCEYECE